MDLIERYGETRRSPVDLTIRQGAKFYDYKDHCRSAPRTASSSHDADRRPVLCARKRLGGGTKKLKEPRVIGVDQFQHSTFMNHGRRDVEGVRRTDHPSVHERRRLAFSVPTLLVFGAETSARACKRVRGRRLGAWPVWREARRTIRV